jgi:hypothetical protein
VLPEQYIVFAPANISCGVPHIVIAAFARKRYGFAAICPYRHDMHAARKGILFQQGDKAITP